VASSLLALLDDVAVMTKVAAKKAAGVLGDDIALNVQQVIGVDSDRELLVVRAVAKGSMVNKTILVPAALLLSAFVPRAVIPLMMIGGAFLCFEGAEKLAHKLLHSKAEDDAHHAKIAEVLIDRSVDVVAFERDKIKGAIRTDFILSAEIIVISLGTVAKEAFLVQVGVLVAIAILMTVGVYGLVAGIVKLDEAGLFLSRREGESGLVSAQRVLGRGILRTAPWLMKFLSIAGTVAMFLVGGGILTHNVPVLHHAIQTISPPGVLGSVVSILADLVVGVIGGAAVLGVKLIGKGATYTALQRVGVRQRVVGARQRGGVASAGAGAGENHSCPPFSTSSAWRSTAADNCRIDLSVSVANPLATQKCAGPPLVG
jgi:predicted DNA repair protein MutK